jgi:nucleoside phosphorylase
LYESELIPLVQGPTDPEPVAAEGGDGPTAVIVTALELEAQAVRDHLTDSREFVHDKGTVYTVGSFDGAVGWRVAIVIAGQGNPTAAAEVERAIEYFKPRVVLLVGIAGALKDLDLGERWQLYRLGDVGERRKWPRW